MGFGRRGSARLGINSWIWWKGKLGEGWEDLEGFQGHLPKRRHPPPTTARRARGFQRRLVAHEVAPHLVDRLGAERAGQGERALALQGHRRRARPRARAGYHAHPSGRAGRGRHGLALHGGPDALEQLVHVHGAEVFPRSCSPLLLLLQRHRRRAWKRQRKREITNSTARRLRIFFNQLASAQLRAPLQKI